MMERNGEETEPPPERLSAQSGPGPAPALVPLLAFVLGISTARLTAGLGSPLVALPMLVAGLTVLTPGVAGSPKARWRCLRGRLVLCLVPALVGFGWSAYRMPLPVQTGQAWRQLPPRAFNGELKVERIWRQPDTWDRVTGLARIQAPDTEWHGERVYAALKAPGPAQPAVGRTAVWSVRGVLEPLNDAALSGGNDFLESLRSRGVGWTLGRGDWRRESQAPARHEQWLQAARNRIKTALATGAQPADRAILRALILGDRTALSEAQAARFKNTGTLHFFAVSGLHVGLLAGALIGGFRLLGVPRPWQGWLMLPGCAVYVGLAGMTVSAQRAFLMLAAWVVADACLRQARPLPAWTLAAWCALLLDPHAIGEAGFLLSFGVVAALLVYGVPWAATLQAWLAYPWRWVPEPDRSLPVRGLLRIGRILTGAGAISLAAWLASSPIIMTAFERMTPWALVLNVPLVLLVGLALPLGLLGGFAATCGFPRVADAVWRLAEPLAGWMDGLTGVVTGWPAAVIPTPGLPEWFPWLAWLGLFAVPILLTRARTWPWPAARRVGAGLSASLLVLAAWLS
ncbi:MAG: ComEC/Rec2 family competence protein [Opitutales bacterium]